jgi:hypothetical protein
MSLLTLRVVLVLFNGVVVVSAFTRAMNKARLVHTDLFTSAKPFLVGMPHVVKSDAPIVIVCGYNKFTVNEITDNEGASASFMIYLKALFWIIITFALHSVMPLQHSIPLLTTQNTHRSCARSRITHLALCQR